MKRSFVSAVLPLVVLLSSVEAAAAKPAPDGKGGAKGQGKGKSKGEGKAERSGPALFDARKVPQEQDLEREAIADKKRDDQIEAAKKIIPKIEDGNPQKAEILFQLSELYWEKSRYLYGKEMVAHFRVQKEADEKRNRGEKVAEPKENHRESELYRSETMRLYETILREYPAYERKDEVLFNLAYNLYDLNKRDQAVKRYEELLKFYPGSKFVPDAYVQLGNHYFEVANVLDKARAYYERAYNSHSPKIKSYALYKLAWCDFNSGQYEKALAKLHQTVEYADKQGKERTFTDLKNEALNDSIRMYVQLDRAEDAFAYFGAHAGKKKKSTLIGKMAYAMQEAGHHDSAIKSFRFLLSENEMAPAAPDYQQAIIKSYEGMRQRESVKAEVKKLAELYRPQGAWWKANESRKDVLRNGFNVAEEAMRTTVTDYHQEAQKTKQVETYRLARDIYKQYVDAFATSSDEAFVADQAFNLKFYYAEILWTLEEWEAAAKQYEGVVTFKIPDRAEAREAANEKYRQSAAYGAILAYEKLVKIERGLLAKSDLKGQEKVDENKKKDKVEKQGKVQKRSAKELAEKPLTVFDQALVAACDTYNQLYPKNSDEVDVAYQAAVLFYDKNHFVDAARRFGDIVNKYPEEKRSQDAADLSMAVLEEKEEWLELNVLARAFKANTRLTKPGSEFSKRVGRIVEGSQYKYIDEVVYRHEKDAPKASRLFLAFAEEFPKSDNADRALTYSMVIAQEAYQLDKAMDTGERILKEYPRSIFDLKVKAALALLHEKMANFEKSAQMYEEFVATYDLAAKDKAVGYANMKELLKKEQEQAAKDAKEAKGRKAKQAEALATVDIAKLAEDKRKEREALIQEASALVADAQYNTAFWYEGVGRFDDAIAAYTRYVTRFKDRKDVPDIAFNIGLVLEKQQKAAEAIKYYEGYLAQFAKDPRVSDARRLDLKYRQYLLNEKLGNSSEQDRLAKEVIAAYPRLKDDARAMDRAKLAFAHVRFGQLEPQWKGYTELKFKKFATFKADRLAKEKKLEELEKAYTDVLAVGSPSYGIAALTRIGMLYSEFAQAISEIPDPPKFDEDQLAMFRGELENRYVFPVEEKAVEALEKALGKSYELAVYTDWTLTAQDALTKYRPGLYGKVRDVAHRGAEFFATSGFEGNVDLSAPSLRPSSAAVAPAAGAGAP